MPHRSPSHSSSSSALLLSRTQNRQTWKTGLLACLLLTGIYLLQSPPTAKNSNGTPKTRSQSGKSSNLRSSSASASLSDFRPIHETCTIPRGFKLMTLTVQITHSVHCCLLQCRYRLDCTVIHQGVAGLWGLYNARFGARRTHSRRTRWRFYSHYWILATARRIFGSQGCMDGRLG